MHLQLLQKASSGLDVHKQHAQAVLSLSIPNSKFSALIPTTIYNNHNTSPDASNQREMDDGFRGKRRSRGDISEDLQQHQQQQYQDVNPHRSLNDSPNASRLLAAPLGQIDDFDGHMDGSSASPTKRIRRHEQHSGRKSPSLPPMSVNVSATSQHASLSQPSLPNSPFVFFFRIERENLLEKAKTGDTHFTSTQQVVQTIEQKWESTPTEDRRIYEQLAAKDQERYKREMEEYERKQQELQEEHERRLSGKGEPLATTNLQSMLYSGVPAGNLATSTINAPPLHPLDPRMQQVNVIAGLRPPLPTVAAAPTTTSAAAPNVAPSHHHFMPPTQPASLVPSSHSMYHPNAITPPQQAVGIAGQPLPAHLPVHHHSPTNASVAALPPNLTTTASGTILLPPSQSMPLPAGMEIEMGGRRYRVGYQYQFMSREEAQKYAKPYTAAQSETSETQREGGPAPSSPPS